MKSITTLLLLFVALTAFPAAFADTESASAVALYNHQQYAPALLAFSSIVQKNPNNVSALYYSANCDVGLGRTSAAISIYKHIVDQFPLSPESISARAVLARMGIRYGETAAVGKTAGAGKGEPVAANATATRVSHRALTTSNKGGVIDKIVVPVRALAGRPEVTSLTVDSIKDALTQYPTPLLSVLVEHGCKIYVTPTMIDKEPQLVNTKPSGYEDGSTYKNCPGMFDGNVVLCENRFVGDGPDLMKSPDIIGTLRHELGHAVDWYLGDLTAKDDFKHQYLLDLGTIDDGVKNKLAYFCQKDFRGPAETFAELMCYKYGGRPNGNDQTSLVGNSFKLSLAYVDKIIGRVADAK